MRVLLLAILIGACSATAPAPVSARPQPKAPTLADLSASFEDLAERVSPAVVEIFATGYRTVAGGQATSTSLVANRKSLGSGAIITPDGFIVTNHHVVAGARRLEVLLPPLRKGKSVLRPRGDVLPARLVGADVETDLAVLKIERADLPSLRLGDSEKLRAGQLVFAFGSPRGLEGSVTMGVVSAVARQLSPEAPVVHVQTDAPINPGNSGGPLCDARGEVVGINTMIFTNSGGSEGLGFAVPSHIVRHVVEQLRKHGRVRRGVIGVHAQTITPALAAGLGLKRTSGVVLGDVYPGSPAARAGLKVGDVVLSLDGKPMENGRQLDVNVYRRSIGDEVLLEVQRGDKVIAIKVPVVERDDDPTRFVPMVDPDRNLVRRLGILVLDLDARLARMLPPLRHPYGVVVAATGADAPREGGGFQPGDVIFGLNGGPVQDLATLQRAVEALPPGGAAVVQLQRGGRLSYVSLEVE